MTRYDSGSETRRRHHETRCSVKKGVYGESVGVKRVFKKTERTMTASIPKEIAAPPD